MQRSSSNRCGVVVRDPVSPGDQGTAAQASSAMCPMVVAVSVAVFVPLAVVFAVPAAAADVDVVEVVDAGGVASGTAARDVGRNY